MLHGTLLHPDLLAGLARCGHGSRVLITDANYPTVSATRESTAKIYLNLSPGVVSVPQVISALISVAPIEAAAVMTPDAGELPSAALRYAELLPDLELEKLSRDSFYQAARGEDVALVVVTGDQELWANLLLTVGFIGA